MAELIQPSIDDLLTAHARSNDPVTSQMAAESVDVKAKQELTLRALRMLDPRPAESWRVSEKAQALQEITRPTSRRLGESTIRTRLNELTKVGLVEITDRYGLTESGGHCGRYKLTPLGLRIAKELKS